MNFKTKTPRSEEYLSYIRTLKCCVHPCQEAVVPHHASKGGVGLKCSDFFTIPLCNGHHRELHDKGQDTFCDKYAIDKWRKIAGLIQDYVIRGCKDK